MSIETRDFKFTTNDFQVIRKLVKDVTGISLSDTKHEMVYSRLAKRLRQLGISRFDDYIKLVTAKDSEELVEFVNALTTNLTNFFREEHHFNTLAKTALPQILAKNKKIKIWSAGCSTGMESYSIAITMLEGVAKSRLKDISVLATDIDSAVLQTAEEGIYNSDTLRGLSDKRKHKWFLKGTGTRQKQVRARKQLRSMIDFQQLNFMDSDWGVQGPFDVIFCRNVLIYFDTETQVKILDQFSKLMQPGGYLFLGHSESLHRKSESFDALGQTTFVRKAN